MVLFGEMVHVESKLTPSPGFHEIAVRGGGYDTKLVQEAEPIMLIAATLNALSIIIIS